MSLTSVTEPWLKAIISTTVSATEKRTVLALQAQPTWTGEPTISVNGRTVHVEVAPSPIAVRDSLRRTRSDGELTVLLTPLDDPELGLDVCARLVKGRVVRADIASSAKSLLELAGIEKRLTHERWLLDELASLKVNEHVALPFRGRILDLDTAWQTWLEHRLGVTAPPSTADELLAMLIAPASLAAVKNLSITVCDAFESRFATLGLPTGVMVSLVQGLRADDLVPLGLVLDVVANPKADARLAALQQTARVRLEAVLGRNQVNVKHELAWATAAVDLAGRAEPTASHRWRSRAEELLVELDAADLATMSASLRRGLEHGMARLATQLLTQWSVISIDRIAMQRAAAELAVLRLHPDATGHSPTLRVLEAALRLTQRRAYGIEFGEASSDVTALAVHYSADLAWVDRCRAALVEGGSGHEVQALAQAVLRDADEERRSFDASFASAFAQWSGPAATTKSEHLVPVEDVLTDVVVPVASAGPVLVLVLDGASVSVMTKLLQSLRVTGWTLFGRGQPAMAVLAAAALPSITECSRMSLLCGALRSGVQADEKRAFAAHPGLRAGAPKSAPVLFHKADLAGPDGAALAPAVRDALVDPNRRVVGVVVNAVDDHLGGGAQVVVGWELADIRHLAQVLDDARDAGRVVILTADHGHVIDAGRSVSRPTSVPERGDRWRTPHEAAGGGELEVRGARVVGGGGHVVLAVDDRIRYGGKKHGYHGGITPQEVLVSLAVLARDGADVAGWTPVSVFEPGWWELGAVPPVEVTPDSEAVAAEDVLIVVAPVVASPKRTKPKPAGPPLFEPEPASARVPTPAGTDWIGSLLVTPLFASQRNAAARQPIDDDRLRSIFRAFRKLGFTMHRDRLTLAVGGQPAKIRGEINTMRRILNVDGYEVLATDAGEMLTLNVELLATQFGLDVSIVRGIS